MNANIRILTVDDVKEGTKVTLSVENIKMVIAKDVLVDDRAVKETTIFFIDGDFYTLHLSDMDLLTIEQVVGAYSFLEE